MNNAVPKQIELNVAARADVVVDAAAAYVQKNQHVRPCPIVLIHRDSFAILAAFWLSVLVNNKTRKQQRQLQQR